MNPSRIFTGLAMAATLPFLASAPAADNIARGRPYSLEPAPNSKDCAGGDAAKKLTDGVYAPTNPAKLNDASPTSIWMSDATAGWMHTFAPAITVDLGADRPISGLSFSTAAGVAQVSWPENIFVHTSVDGTTWHSAGDLVKLDAAKAPEEGRHRFTARDLKTHARYVRFIPVGKPYIFCDEIEIYSGPEESLQAAPSGEPIGASGADWAAAEVERLRPLQRIRRDVELVRQTVASAKPVDPAVLVALDRKLRGLGEALPRDFAFDPETFRATLPLGPAHAAILAVNGELLQASGHAPLVVWQRHRFDRLGYLEAPPLRAQEPRLSIDVLRGETRADSLLLTNATSEPLTATVRFEGLPGDQKWLRVSTGVWTDTAEGVPVADALVPVEPADGKYTIAIPAGLTLPVWVEVNAAGLSPGEHKGEVVVTAGEVSRRVPLEIRVSPIAMDRPRLSLGMWDESNGNGGRGLSEKNLSAAIALMCAGHVDTPWADPDVMPFISSADFDAEGALDRRLDFSHFDEWIARWPDARYYAVFLNVSDEFGGSRIGQPDFDKKVASWSRAFADHVRSRNLDPRRVVLLLVDEPRNESQDKITAAWTRVVKTSGTGFTIMTNPIWDKPQATANQAAITQADVVCPNLRIFTEGGRAVETYFSERRKQGQAMWLYLCEGPVRHFDPHSYYRMQAWKAFQQDATGISFWAFGDLGGARSSWNEYSPQQSLSYAPAFIGSDDATDSIHWQAVKEGVQDFEYLALLRDALPGANAALAEEGRALLAEAVRSTLADYSTDYRWARAANRAQPDTYRRRIIRLLEQIQAADVAAQKS